MLASLFTNSSPHKSLQHEYDHLTVLVKHGSWMTATTFYLFSLASIISFFHPFLILQRDLSGTLALPALLRTGDHRSTRVPMATSPP